MNNLLRPSLPLFGITAALLLCIAAPAHAQVSTWIGGSNSSSNWDDSANWQGGAIPDGNTDMTFTGNLRTTNNNNFSNNQISLNFLDFDSTADPFTLQGSPCQITHPGGTNTITNHSTNLQTLDFNAAMSVQVNVTIDAVSGDIRVNNGLFLQAFQTNSADLTVTGSNNTTLAGDISDDTNLNPAGIIKNGTGTLTLTGNNTFRGDVTINSGVVEVGSLNALGAGDTVVVGTGSDATLQTAGPDALTFNVGHDFRMIGGVPLTTLRMKIGGLTAGVDSDLMNVGHDAFLAGDLFLHRINNFMPLPGERVTIIQTLVPCTVNGTFDAVDSDFPGLIQPMADYSQDHVDVVFELTSSFESQGITPNQEAVGAALDHAVSDNCVPDLIRFLGSALPSELPHDYDLIAPEELTSIYEIGFSQAVVHNDNLMRRMDDIRAGSGGYCPVVEVPTMSGKEDYKNVADKNVAPVPVVQARDCRWSVFATGSGDFANVGDDDENSPGYDITTGSVIAGVDYRVCDHFAVGIDGGYFSSRADLVDRGRVDVDGGKIGAYATVFGKGLFGSKIYLDAAVDGGWNSYDTNRTGLSDVTPEGEIARGSTNGSEFNALISYGSDWTFGCFNIGTWSSLQFTNVSIDSFTEEGSLAPLQISGQDQESFRATSGIRASYDIKAGRGIFRPEVRGAWLHEYGDRSYGIDARFIDCPTPFTVHGPQIGRDAALIGAGLSMQWSRCFATYVYYDGVLGRSNYDNNAVSGGVRIGF